MNPLTINKSTDQLVKKSNMDLTKFNESNKKVKKPNKLLQIAENILKILGLLTCLYFFVVSLNLMSASFPLIAGRYASEAFRSNVVLTNPMAGLMIGLLATVVVQSSSTSTSIIVSMVASEIIPVKYAIPIIMGSNIGTSITSTLVALSQAMDKEKFRRSFAGATVHDMFNLLTVAVLLPVELIFGYLEKVSDILVLPLSHNNNPNAKEPELLNAITKPLTEAIIQIDKHVLDKIATNQSSDDVSLIKRICKFKTSIKVDVLNATDDLFGENFKMEERPCEFLFNYVLWPDWVIGLILLLVSLITLSTCLVSIVKILSSILNGPVAHFIQNFVNSDLPGVFKYFTGFVAICLGAILTVLVQSSSVFTSTLTPLVGMGLVSIERVYPLTLGSNIGTTVTGILASISGPTKTLKYSLQIALCHTLFNISGILIWYPIPYLRKIPLDMARFLGDKTANYRWFAILYLIVLFFLLPLITFLLSLLGKVFFIVVMTIVILLTFAVIKISYLQKHHSTCLPTVLQDWKFLPLPLRSLKPYDSFIRQYLCCFKCCRKLITTSNSDDPDLEAEKQEKNEKPSVIVVHTNKAFDHTSF